jgi:nucleoside phosphorylase
MTVLLQPCKLTNTNKFDSAAGMIALERCRDEIVSPTTMLSDGRNPMENCLQQGSPSRDVPVGETITQSESCPTLKVEDYTVGWICALPLEMSAAMATFDEFNTKLKQRSADHNTYMFGRIGDHNVVVACLPKGRLGSASAAVVADQMRSSFPSIRFGLMVGIGGGAPSPSHDIRLGDVVVSNPEGVFGGVVEYDYGKTVKGGKFLFAGSLNKPPERLRTAISALSAVQNLKGNLIMRHVEKMVDRYPLWREKLSYQRGEHDRLFEAAYDHQRDDDDDCSDCDPQRLVPRFPRSNPHPVIHYGLIASANQVMRDAHTRDRIKDELNGKVLCFEMEAAGLDSFPCLVIRGICDYADTHKNKRWQEYAAATAAAYAKELLSIIPTSI